MILCVLQIFSLWNSQSSGAVFDSFIGCKIKAFNAVATQRKKCPS